MSSKFKNIVPEPPTSPLEDIVLSNLQGRKQEESSREKLEAWILDTQGNIELADWKTHVLRHKNKQLILE